MAENKGEALLGAEVGDPVPAEEAFDSDDQVFAVGPEGAQDLLTTAGELLVDEDVAGLIEDAQIEAAGVEVDAAVVNMLFRVESHRGLLSWFFQPTAYRGGRPEGASTSIPADRADGKPPLIGTTVGCRSPVN
jgi:hypothetical protein